MSTTAPFQVLHLDDDEGVLDLAGRVLFEADDRIDVTSVRTPDEALAAIESGCDCLVTDSIRTADGEYIALAARRAEPDLPIVLFSGQDRASLADLAERSAAAGYVRKGGPAKLAALGARVSRLADRTAAETPELDTGQGWEPLGFFDVDREDDLVVALADSVAAPETGRPPLGEVVDADALQRFLASAPEAQATFVYHDRELAIDGRGAVYARPIN
jgi:CheY-like chemotaxis protein